MKINTLLTTSILLAAGVSTECARAVVANIFQFVCLLGLFVPKLAVCVSSDTCLASSVLMLARTAIWDGRIAFLVLQLAVWFAKIFLLAAVFAGHAK